VADLVVPLPDVDANVAGNSAKADRAGKQSPTTEEELIKLIVTTIQADSWKDLGGRGDIQYFPAGMALVIEQTPAVHQGIADLLAALRRINDLQVMLEIRLINISETCLERVGVDFESNLPRAEGALERKMEPAGADKRNNEPVNFQNPGVAFLDERQVFTLLEAAQGDCRTNVMQTPRLTLGNGQVGNVDTMATNHALSNFTAVRKGDLVLIQPANEPFKTGFRLSARPVVSADRRFVRLDLKFTQADVKLPIPVVPVQVPIRVQGDQTDRPAVAQLFLERPQLDTITTQCRLSVPDGKTVVLRGPTKLVESRTEVGPPVLSSIPYVNRLFRTTCFGRGAETLLVMVTPRIMPASEAEEKVVAVPPSLPAQLLPECKPSRGPTCIGTGVAQAGCPVAALANQPALSGPISARPGPPEPLNIRPRPVIAPQKAATDASVVEIQSHLIVELLQAYDQACAAGRADHAERLARAALALDPSCFHKGR
jgi:general secretion pathway protein D